MTSSVTLRHPQLCRAMHFPVIAPSHILCHRFLQLFAQSSGCPQWPLWVQRAWRRLRARPVWVARCVVVREENDVPNPLEARLFVDVDLLPLVLQVGQLSPLAQSFLHGFDFGAVKQSISSS
jgi:hypothetical protein